MPGLLWKEKHPVYFFWAEMKCRKCVLRFNNWISADLGFPTIHIRNDLMNGWKHEWLKMIKKLGWEKTPSVSKCLCRLNCYRSNQSESLLLWQQNLSCKPELNSNPIATPPVIPLRSVRISEGSKVSSSRSVLRITQLEFSSSRKTPDYLPMPGSKVRLEVEHSCSYTLAGVKGQAVVWQETPRWVSLQRFCCFTSH